MLTHSAPSSTAIAGKLTRASRVHRWDVDVHFDWPDAIPETAWCTSPELVSIHGTPLWSRLDEAQQRKVALYEAANFFSLTLQGERSLVSGMSELLYSSRLSGDVTEYLHHFLDEENKHMAMFGAFCTRYIGKVYPEKKVVIPRRRAKGEAEIALFCKVMVVEEVGDYFNVLMQRDARLHPVVREIHAMHHRDEARHIGFGRAQTRELWARYATAWSDAERGRFQDWLGDYVRSTWGDFYNPSVYRDAGLADAPWSVDPYALRREAMAHPDAVATRVRASRRVVDHFVRSGFLREPPTL